MAGFFKRLANRLWRAEQHTKTLGASLHALVQQLVANGDAEKEMVIFHTPLLPGVKQAPCVEFCFLRRSLLTNEPDIAELFSGQWNEYSKDFMVMASIPTHGGRKRDLFFLAAYDTEWDQLDASEIRKGIIEGIAVNFHEEMETAIRSWR